MGLKIYREINNNDLNDNDKNILLEFICNVDLWDATDIFDSCLHYDSEEDEFYEVSEVYHDRLSSSVDYLRHKIERLNNNPAPERDYIWLQEAQRCYDILSKELNNRTDGFYILFI